MSFSRIFGSAGRLLALMVGLTVQTATAHAEGWQKTCEAGGRCTAILTMTEAANKDIVVRVGIQIGPNNSEPLLVAFLPLGVAMEPGIRVIVGGKEIKASYQVCYPDGCRAVASMTPGDLESWFGAQTASLQFFPFSSDKPVAMEVPLAGLREALLP